MCGAVYVSVFGCSTPEGIGAENGGALLAMNPFEMWVCSTPEGIGAENGGTERDQ